MAKKTVTLESWLTTTAHPAIMRAENYRVATDGHSAAGELDRSGQTAIDPAQHEAEFCLKTYREAVSRDPIITLSVAGLELLAQSFSAKSFSVNLQFNGPDSTPRVYVRHLKTGCTVEADVDSTAKFSLNVTVAKSAPTAVNVHLLLRAAQFLGASSIDICRENRDNSLQPLAISWAGTQQDPTRWALVMPVRM